jgi:predicted NUDIX family NTP pyrophosphohydrolase
MLFSLPAAYPRIMDTSAGILLFRTMPARGLEVFIGHMGGPFWSRKDDGAWSIPKGLFTDESALDAAKREFAEEIGAPAPDVDYVLLGDFRYSNKRLTVFTAEADAAYVASNTFEVEWPPRSGKLQQFPEIDRAEWFPVKVARTKLVKGQIPLLDALSAASVEP